MEKYRRFADQFTGINPFLPVFLNKKKKASEIILKLLLGPILVLIRLPLILIFALLLVLYHSIFIHLLVVNSFKRVVTLFNHLVCLRVILFLMGFYKFKTSFKILSKEGSNKSPPPKMNSGFIVLANHTSPVDYIYMTYLMSPIFSKQYISTKDSSQTKVLLSPLSFFQTIKAAFSLDYSIPVQGDDTELAKHHDQKLKVISLIQSSFDEHKGPLCVFFEGAKTNGYGFLQAEESLIQDIAEVQEKYRREVVVFNLKYTDKSHFSPINTTRNPFLHFILLLTNFSNELKVSAKGIPFQDTTQTGPLDIKQYKESIYSFYESSGIKKMQVTWREYQKFLDYWQNSQSKQYIEEIKKRE
ncbi:acyltransferase (macronuclear) [Tetrahymena thermophila SB210]|uniref:Acyltransferase n=1 Tax=Tetrahymena thermophila (strain SB210) TaxID=312017 RepID=I7MF20_TETTS|nr:acyltransferase [Tetrahymena thermophila SB210]EAR98330.1 acyltransferase [Tetrahymena thermophila SB210]|eukprot:XP_001018575.1 acyltransferase [Tetrahymena thermophila SB210]